MLSRIAGVFQGFTENGVLVDVGGLGFEILVSPTTQRQMPREGAPIKLETILLFRQEAPLLFGFIASAEKNVFQVLISVQGVGPKLALAILGALPVDKLLWALKSADEKALTQVDGVGPKLARRLLTELKDKVEKMHTLSLNSGIRGPESGTAAASSTAIKTSPETVDSNGIANDSIQEEALLALASLGYEKSHCYAVINQVLTQEMAPQNAADLIKAALRKLSPLMNTHREARP